MFKTEQFEADAISAYKSGIRVQRGTTGVRENEAFIVVQEDPRDGCCIIGATLVGKIVPEEFRDREFDPYTMFTHEYFTLNSERARLETNVIWELWDNMLDDEVRIPWLVENDFAEEIRPVLERILEAVS